MITIVIPVFNRVSVVQRTLASLEAQTVAPSRVVLVDNGSTDGSLEVLQQWQHRMAARGWDVKVCNELQLGACAARNTGLGLVETPWVMFFDSDDVMSPHHVADFTQAINANPEAGVIGRDIDMEMASGSRKRGYFCDRDVMFNHLFRGCFSTQRYVARTALVRQAGLWDNDMKVWNDYELGLRLLLLNPVVRKIVGEPTVKTCFLDSSITGAAFSLKAGKWENTLNKCRSQLLKAGRPELVKWIDARAMILAAHYYREGRKDLAQKLYDDTVSLSPHPRRMSLIYHHNRVFHHLTWAVAKALFLGTKKG